MFTFDHVNFGYNENQTIINDFSADIKEGQQIAIVGPTEQERLQLLNY